MSIVEGGDTPLKLNPETAAATPLNDGGPAFPCPWGCDAAGMHLPADPKGMSLRDWFAGHAMLAMFTQLNIDHTESGQINGEPLWQTGDAQDRLTVACRAYIIADAMIAARAAGK